VFVHDAVVMMFTRHLQLIEQHDDYCNFPLKPATVLEILFFVSKFLLVRFLIIIFCFY